jgi:tetratricopeptide (TPR) repeat protein
MGGERRRNKGSAASATAECGRIIHRPWFIALLLAGLTGLVFGQTVTFDFVSYDDPTYILESPRVLGGFSLDSVRWAFTTGYFANWHPLTWLSYFLDAELFGKDARGYHFTNVLLHTANVVLLFAVLRALTAHSPLLTTHHSPLTNWQCAFVAALFAIHPLHVETVAWVSERKGLLSTLFALLAIWAYVQYVRRPRWTWYAAMLLAFVASLLSKQMMVTLPFVLLLLDYWPLGRFSERRASWKRLVAEKLPLFGLMVLFSAIALAVQQRGRTVVPLEAIPFSLRLWNGVAAYLLYLSKTFWPVRLAPYYPHPGESLSMVLVGVSALVLVAVSGLAVWQRRGRPYLLVGWLWYLGTLVPVIGLVQLARQQMADRYSYVPLVGVFVAVAWLLPSVVPARWAKARILETAGVGIVVVLSVFAWKQTQHWRDSFALFEHLLAAADPQPVAYRVSPLVTEAISPGIEVTADGRRVMRIRPAHALAHNQLAIAFDQKGERETALSHLRAALEANPHAETAHINLGNILREEKRYDEAARHYQIALTVDPGSALAHMDYGNLLREMRRFDEAVAHLQTAVRLDPESALARYNLAVTFGEQGRFPEAIHQYQEALRIAPGNSQAHNNLGSALDEVGRFDLARYHYEQAIRLNPEDARAHNNLGVLLIVRYRNRERAIEHFRAAVRSDPEFRDAQENLQHATGGR